MGLVDDIKTAVKKSGTNKGKFIYFKPENKIRVRFLDDMENGFKISFHDSFQLGINVPCQEAYGRDCEYHDNNDLRTRDQFAWSVWDYEANEVKVLMGPVNNFSPIPQLVGMFETYGTIVDRDYVITKHGSQQNSSFTVVPMDKVKFKNSKAKPFSESKFLSIVDKAFPNEESNGSGDEDEQKDYESMSPKKLYELCKERDIEVETKKSKEYYIEKLEEDDNLDDDWGDEETKQDYESLSPKELYSVCQDRGLDVKTKQNKEYYIKKLQDDDSKSDDGWDDDEKKKEDEENDW